MFHGGPKMIGAECLLRTLLANRIDLCFMNPGTSEMQFVAALDRVPEMRGILCLFEGVCSGAADGYARMTGKPAATLLHLGPGLANALSNLHNARKALSPVINIVGEHSTAHLHHDAPLTADIEAFAEPVSSWVGTLDSASNMGIATSAAVAAALGPPGKVATLIIPADFSWSEAGELGTTMLPPVRPLPHPEQIRTAVETIRSGKKVALLLAGTALQESGLHAAAALGLRIFAHRYAARLTRGIGVPSVERIPYFPENAQAALAGFEHIILVEARPPVSFFGYPGVRSTLAPENCIFDTLATESQDGVGALEWLVRELGLSTPAVPALTRTALPDGGPLTASNVGQTVAALLPERAIISEESVSSGEAMLPHFAGAAIHDLLPVTGGSIGQGLPVAVGAALACPRRKIVALEADGSAMYSLQALWTMARERLDITVVILANRRYRVLDIEMRRTGAGAVGPRADEMIDLTNPIPDFVSLAQGFGVDAARATTTEEFVSEFRAAMQQSGPRLIEAVLALP
jgi:acetolactate synthase-1/2/3 large subunit